jgi:hypothetical protein
MTKIIDAPVVDIDALRASIRVVSASGRSQLGEVDAPFAWHALEFVAAALFEGDPGARDEASLCGHGRAGDDGGLHARAERREATRVRRGPG